MADLTGNPALDNAPIGDLAHDAPPATTTTNPALGPDAATVGGTTTTPPPGLLSRAWTSLADIPATIAREIANPTPAGPENAPPNAATAFWSGIGHGVRDAVIDKPAEWLARNFGGSDEGNRVAQINQADKDTAAATYKDNPGSFDAGHMTGAGLASGLATSRVLGLGGAAGNIIGSRVVAPFAPAIGNAIGVGSDVVSGTAGADMTGIPGIATRTAVRVPSGASGGAIGAGLSGDDMAQGAAIGAVLSPVLGLPAEAIATLMRGLGGSRMSPLPSGQLPDRVQANANAAQDLIDRGIPVASSQVSSDPSLQLSTKLPFSGRNMRIEDQLQKFRTAGNSEMGETGSMATPDVLRGAADRIGQVYDNTVGSASNIDGTGINPVLAQIRGSIPAGLTREQQGQITDSINTVQNAFSLGGGTITGDVFQNLTRRGTGALEPLVNSDNPTVRAYGLQLRSELDQRLQAALPKDQQTALAQASRQYRAMKTIAGAVQPDGTYTPGQLMGQVQAQSDLFDSGNRGVAFSDTAPLAKLARSGDTIISPSLASKSAAVSDYSVPIGGMTVPALTAGATAHLLGSGLLAAGGAGVGIGAPLAYLASRGMQAADWGPGGAQTAIKTALSGRNPPLDLRTAIQILTQGARSGAQNGASGVQPFPYTNSNP